MYSVRVSSNVPRRTSAFVRRMSAMPAEALAIAEEAAELERSSHAYTNRTGNLEAETQAEVVHGPDPLMIVLRQGNEDVFYGGYVQALGYSDFTALADYAAVGIDTLMRRMRP